MATSDVCTTQEAADILGISVSSVQQLVETGVIQAWKTKGGHRRIPVSAVRAYKAASLKGYVAPSIKQDEGADEITSVLVVEDNPMQRELYAQAISSWNLPLKLTFGENGYQALVQIARQPTDVLLADIVMEGIDGYEVIKTILGYPELSKMDIALISSISEEELTRRGGVPSGVVFFPKPVNFDELRGYLRACCARKARR